MVCFANRHNVSYGVNVCIHLRDVLFIFIVIHSPLNLLKWTDVHFASDAYALDLEQTFVEVKQSSLFLI